MAEPNAAQPAPIQVPDWDDHAIKRKPVASNADPPAYDTVATQEKQSGFQAKFDSVLSPHRKYLGLTRKTFLIVAACAVLALLALIIGLAVGLTRHSSYAEHPRNTTLQRFLTIATEAKISHYQQTAISISET